MRGRPNVYRIRARAISPSKRHSSNELSQSSFCKHLLQFAALGGSLRGCEVHNGAEDARW